MYRMLQYAMLCYTRCPNSVLPHMTGTILCGSGLMSGLAMVVVVVAVVMVVVAAMIVVVVVTAPGGGRSGRGSGSCTTAPCVRDSTRAQKAANVSPSARSTRTVRVYFAVRCSTFQKQPWK